MSAPVVMNKGTGELGVLFRIDYINRQIVIEFDGKANVFLVDPKQTVMEVFNYHFRILGAL